MNDSNEIENLVDNIKQEFIYQYQCNSPDNFEAQMRMSDEIDNSFENELDRSTYEQGPKLILCDHCSREFLLPNWISASTNYR